MPEHGEQVPMLTSADVVVIGGGIIGAAIAYYLAKRNVQVQIVERSFVGSATSSASSGTVALQTKSLGAKLTLAQRSMKLLHALKCELDIDFEFEADGSLVVAQTEQELSFLRQKADKLRTVGVLIDILDGDDARAYLPALSETILGASYCADDASINPLRLVQAFHRGATSRGVRIATRTDVTGIEVRNGTIQAVNTSAGQILTKTIVNAAGVWADTIGQMVGMDLPIVPRKGEILVTEATRPLIKGELLSASYLTSKDAPILSIADWKRVSEVQRGELKVGIAANQQRAGNLLVGSTREFAGFDTRSTHRGIVELVRHMTALMPMVRGLQIIRSYAGLRPATMDGMPILDRHPELPGFVVACGHEGDGIALSAVTGELIAALIAGDDVQQHLAPFALSRFAA